MYKLLIFLLFLLSCTATTQAKWDCNSGVKIADYTDSKGQHIRYKIDFSQNSAVKFGKVTNVHEDTYRNIDLYFSVDEDNFVIGNIVVKSNIFNIDSWEHGNVKCFKKKQHTPNEELSAAVVCSENPTVGSMEYIFERGRGITTLQFIYSNGETVSYYLIGKEGLAKFC
jgi:hypothetical protein